MESLASESKLFQSLSKVEIPGQARWEERLSSSTLNLAFLIDSDTKLFTSLIWPMKSSASEPGRTVNERLTLNTWNASNWIFLLLSLSRFIISFKFSGLLMYLVITVKLWRSSKSSPRSYVQQQGIFNSYS